jgi:hypothetical protein
MFRSLVLCPALLAVMCTLDAIAAPNPVTGPSSFPSNSDHPTLPVPAVESHPPPKPGNVDRPSQPSPATDRGSQPQPIVDRPSRPISAIGPSSQPQPASATPKALEEQEAKPFTISKILPRVDTHRSATTTLRQRTQVKPAVAAVYGGIQASIPGPPDPGSQPQIIEPAKYRENVRSWYAYQIRTREHTMDLCCRQAFWSELIFYLVLALVGAGMALSWMQFRLSFRSGHAAAVSATSASTIEQAADGSVRNTIADITINMSGLTVKSSMLGIVILAMSLAFFFLFLKYVYPIQFISVAPP